MKIEDILKYLLNDNFEYEGLGLPHKILEKEEIEILLNYIADLQRKEYNNSKAIEYIKRAKYVTETMEGEEFYKNYEYSMEDLLNILEKGE